MFRTVSNEVAVFEFENKREVNAKPGDLILCDKHVLHSDTREGNKIKTDFHTIDEEYYLLYLKSERLTKIIDEEEWLPKKVRKTWYKIHFLTREGTYVHAVYAV